MQRQKLTLIGEYVKWQHHTTSKKLTKQQLKKIEQQKLKHNQLKK